MIEKKNARIRSTMLGFEDHGIMTFFLYLEYGGSGQGAGGFCLGGTSLEVIPKILKTVGVEKWEDLPGQHIVVEAEHTKVHGIGPIIGDGWLNFEAYFKSLDLQKAAAKP